VEEVYVRIIRTWRFGESRERDSGADWTVVRSGGFSQNSGEGEIHEVTGLRLPTVAEAVSGIAIAMGCEFRVHPVVELTVTGVPAPAVGSDR
jgi:hypothetical protein